MIQELVFTSAQRGLQIGKSGFCTVASTSGMADNLVRLLESLSGYRHINPPGSKGDLANPVCYSHLLSKVGGRELHIVSRVADAGLDYSGRSNKLAHHLVFDRAELPPGGPAGLVRGNPFLLTWDREPERLNPRRLEGLPAPPRIPAAWARLVGDPGWAGVLAESAATRKTAYIIVNTQTDARELVLEALALLPSQLQAETTFSTFFTGLPSSVTCLWRFVIAGSQEALAARRNPQHLVIDCTGTLAPAGGEAAELARRGQPLSAAGPTRAASAATGTAAAELPQLPPVPADKAGRFRSSGDTGAAPPPLSDANLSPMPTEGLDTPMSAGPGYYLPDRATNKRPARGKWLILGLAAAAALLFFLGLAIPLGFVALSQLSNGNPAPAPVEPQASGNQGQVVAESGGEGTPEQAKEGSSPAAAGQGGGGEPASAPSTEPAKPAPASESSPGPPPSAPRLDALAEELDALYSTLPDENQIAAAGDETALSALQSPLDGFQQKYGELEATATAEAKTIDEAVKTKQQTVSTRLQAVQTRRGELQILAKTLAPATYEPRLLNLASDDKNSGAEPGAVLGVIQLTPDQVLEALRAGRLAIYLIEYPKGEPKWTPVSLSQDPTAVLPLTIGGKKCALRLLGTASNPEQTELRLEIESWRENKKAVLRVNPRIAFYAAAQPAAAPVGLFVVSAWRDKDGKLPQLVRPIKYFVFREGDEPKIATTLWSEPGNFQLKFATREYDKGPAQEVKNELDLAVEPTAQWDLQPAQSGAAPPPSGPPPSYPPQGLVDVYKQYVLSGKSADLVFDIFNEKQLDQGLDESFRMIMELLPEWNKGGFGQTNPAKVPIGQAIGAAFPELTAEELDKLVPAAVAAKNQAEVNRKLEPVRAAVKAKIEQLKMSLLVPVVNPRDGSMYLWAPEPLKLEAVTPWLRQEGREQPLLEALRQAFPPPQPPN